MILIVAAMKEERDALLTHCTSVTSSLIADIEVVQGTIEGRQVAIVLSGVGKANASYAVSLSAYVLNPSLIINIGSAGGLKENQHVGDIVVSNSVSFHDLNIGDDTDRDPRFIFEPDVSLIPLIEKTSSQLHLPIHVGKVVTGDQFVTYGSRELESILKRFPDAVCVEMEAGAVGTVAKRMNIPFIVIRALSDVPLYRENDLTFERFLQTASQNSALICTQIIANLS